MAYNSKPNRNTGIYFDNRASMQKNADMRPEQAWSLLDPKPISLYLPHCDEYIVYWNGLAMTHSMALCMSMESIGIWPSPEMRTAMEQQYRKIYYAGGFNTRAWDEKVAASDIYPYLKRIMKDHLDKTVKDKDPRIVLKWFDHQRSRVEEDK